MPDLRFTRLSFSRPWACYAKVQQGYSYLVRNRPFQLSLRKRRSLSFLNLGCGDRPHSDFINLDYNWIPGVDVCWDLTRPLPFEDASMAGVFSEHCLEHLPHDAACRLLGEILRVLCPGGALRIVVPDAELYLRTYVDWHNGDRHPFPVTHPADADPATFSPIIAVNRVFRDYGHCYAYDYDCLALMLRQQHFQAIARCDFRQGRESALLIDAESRRCESLYVEASR